MKGMKKINKLMILIPLILATGSASAAYERHFNGLMCKPDEVFFIDPSSNYAKESAQFITDIYVTGEQIKTAIMEGSQAQIMEFNKQMTNLVNSMIGIDQAAFSDKLKQDSAMKEKEMAYESNIAEEQVRQSKAVLYKDDTKEEMQLIVKHLQENPDLPVPVIILSMVAKYDEGGVKIPIPIKAAEGVCDTEQIEKGYCSIMKNITPGKKLSKFFKACNNQKRELVRKVQGKESQKASIIENAIKSSQVVNNLNAASAQIDSSKAQLKGSCNVSDYKNKLCGNDLTKEEFQEKVALNHIIPNGSISPDNLLSPTFYGGSNLRKYDSDTVNELKSKALSKDAVQSNTEQSFVPIVYTYKNTNQYVTALQYVDNVSGSFIVSNQSPEKRKLKSSAEFQALFQKRMAVLSLVRSSFVDAIKRRRGENISKEVSKGNVLEISDNPMKESILGASEYDILLSKVDGLFASVAVKATAKLGESASMDEIANGSEKQFKKAQLDTLKLQTEIMLSTLREGEKIELLKSAQVAAIINSPEMISYLEILRK